MNFDEVSGEKLAQEVIEKIIQEVDSQNCFCFNPNIYFDGFMKIAMQFWQNGKLDIVICCNTHQMGVFMNKDALNTGTIEFSYFPNKDLSIKFLNNPVINCTFMEQNQILIINHQNLEAKKLIVV